MGVESAAEQEDRVGTGLLRAAASPPSD
jgi:hypothetical protein